MPDRRAPLNSPLRKEPLTQAAWPRDDGGAAVGLSSTMTAKLAAVGHALFDLEIAVAHSSFSARYRTRFWRVMVPAATEGCAGRNSTLDRVSKRAQFTSFGSRAPRKADAATPRSGIRNQSTKYRIAAAASGAMRIFSTTAIFPLTASTASAPMDCRMV